MYYYRYTVSIHRFPVELLLGSGAIKVAGLAWSKAKPRLYKDGTEEAKED